MDVDGNSSCSNRRIASSFAVYTAALLSGGASLCYEVVWTRALVVPLGNSSDAAALVLGGFMLGMAVGARLGGAWSERTRSPLAIYAIIEGALATYGALVPFAFATLSSIGMGSGGSGPALWARSAAAFALVAFPSVGMGATFPLLVRTLTRGPASMRSLVGVAYATNTGGAALGAIATGFIAIPALGVRSCSTWAAGIQLAGGGLLLVANALTRGAQTNDAEPFWSGSSLSPQSAPGRDTTAVAEGSSRSLRQRLAHLLTGSSRVKTAALASVFVSGFAMLACETLWARVLTFVFGHDTYAFATLVAIVLLGSALGGLLQRLAARASQRRLLGVLLSLFAPSVLASFWAAGTAVVRFGRDPFHLDALGGLATSASLELFRELVYAPLLVLVPSLLSGAIYATACSAYADDATDAGRKTGIVALANGLGATLGAFVAALGLVSAAGIQGAFTLVASTASLAAAAMVAAAWFDFDAARDTNRNRRPYGAVAVAMIAPVLVIAVRASMPGDLPRRMLLQAVGARHQTLLHYEEGRTGTVSVIENQINGEKQLVMNAVNEVTTRLVHDQSFKLLGHLGPLLHPQPRRAVMICLGAGLSAGAALAHPLERLDVIDLSSAVANGARHFATENRHALDDGRLHLHIDDGRQFLLNTSSRYDVAIIDSTHPKAVDSWILYTKEFYQLVLARLGDDGIVVQWLPLHGLSEREFQIVVRTFYEVFPDMTLWANAGFETYGHVGYAKLVGTRGGPLQIDYARLAVRLQHSEIADDLIPFGMASPEEILDLFVAQADDIAIWTRGIPSQTDDHPLLPYTTRYSNGRRMVPALLLALRAPVAPLLRNLGSNESAVRSALDQASEAQGLVLAGQLERAAELAPASAKVPLFLAQVRTTRPYYSALAERYHDDPDKLFESATQLAGMGFGADAGRLLESALAIRPNDVRLRVERALLLSELGKHSEAIAQLTRLHNEMPDSALVSYDLGAAHLAADQPEAAAVHLRSAVADDPDRVGAWLLLAQAEAKLSHADRARVSLERLLVRHPSVAEAHDRLGQIAAATGQTDAAIAHHRQALRLSPYRADFLDHLGKVLEGSGARDEAEAVYVRALRLAPTDVHALRRLAMIHAARGELESAADGLIRALELDAEDANTALELGRILIRQGKRDEAIGSLCLALKLSPNLPAATRELAQMHVEPGACSSIGGH